MKKCFQQNIGNSENAKSHSFRQSANSLINIRFWEVFSGPKRKKRIFALSGAQKWKFTPFCVPEHFFHSSHPKNAKVGKERKGCYSNLARLEYVYIYVS